jgi:hypothetical protein
MKIDGSDLLILLGLGLMGYGLYLFQSLPVSIISVGIIILNFGILRSIVGKR